MATTKSTKRRMSRAERQQAREAAQAKAQAALDRLGEGVRAVYDSERWETWLRGLARFHDYSLNNTLLIAMQMPTATHVASFRSWKRDFNRHVRKGERGIEILVPMLVKCRDEDEGQDADEERRRLVGFRVGHVFDVSQTEGEPLPTIVDVVARGVDRYAATLEANRAVREVQAESVAYAVSAALGLDTSGCSFGYVTSWAVGRTDDEMRACLQVVHAAARDMLAELQEAMAS